MIPLQFCSVIIEHERYKIGNSLATFACDYTLRSFGRPSEVFLNGGLGPKKMTLSASKIELDKILLDEERGFAPGPHIFKTEDNSRNMPATLRKACHATLSPGHC